jgi:hypothetical protein
LAAPASAIHQTVARRRERAKGNTLDNGGTMVESNQQPAESNQGSAAADSTGNEAQPSWQPVGPIERRVLGVLAEKAKTTPDAYPLSLSALCSGCNQKSNRDPVMQIEPDDLEPVLERLRELGAVALVEGHGRVQKFRHYLYQWLGVDKVELAVMAELLLRGPQSEGELRGRAARMEPIRDLSALRPVLTSLKQKKLVIALTPEGRGHRVTHALYLPKEFQRLEAHYAGAADAGGAAASIPDDSPTKRQEVVEQEIIDIIRKDIDVLRGQLDQLRDDVKTLAADHRQTQEQVNRLRDELGA